MTLGAHRETGIKNRGGRQGKGRLFFTNFKYWMYVSGWRYWTNNFVVYLKGMLALAKLSHETK